MERLSVSVDDDLAAWIESQAEKRGVSKAKVIRDSIETARITGLVQSDEADIAAGEELLDRVVALEARVAALEGGAGVSTADQDGADIVTAFRAQLEGQPPMTDHGERAVTRVFSLLVDDGPMEAAELRAALYPAFEDAFSSPESMWQSINRYFSEIDGIEKVGHGRWDAAPEQVTRADE